MMVFSKIHKWQGEEAVKQILVFPSVLEEQKFTEEHNKRLEEARAAGNGIDQVSDTGIGAIYKLRIVKTGNGGWMPVIRCGLTGIELWTCPAAYSDEVIAMINCVADFKKMIFADIERLVICSATQMVEEMSAEYDSRVRTIAERVAHLS